MKTLQTTNQRENHQLRNTEQPVVASSAHLLLFLVISFFSCGRSLKQATYWEETPSSNSVFSAAPWRVAVRISPTLRRYYLLLSPFKQSHSVHLTSWRRLISWILHYFVQCFSAVAPAAAHVPCWESLEHQISMNPHLKIIPHKCLFTPVQMFFQEIKLLYL